MPHPRVVLRPTGADVRDGATAALRERFAAIRTELGLAAPYPADAVAEAQEAARVPTSGEDLTEVPFFTIDPAGSTDLDQAMHLDRDGDGHHIRYAIADVPSFVGAGGALDRVTRERGQTVYCPDERVPLHPPVLADDAASLLPGQVRPAFVWDLRLDGAGELRSARVGRATVRSTERFDYATVQRNVESAEPDPRLVLLREIGERRLERERARGGASLPLPEQQVRERPDGGFSLEFRPAVPAEDWNAQISLLTGMAAASMMLDAGVGVLRTMPSPGEEALGRFRRAARGLGATWPEGMPYGEFLRTVDRALPRHLALIHEASTLFRGAAYHAFDGAAPEQPDHAAVAAPYAHVTAPLRRLVDRFGLVVCAAVSNGTEVPAWARAALPSLPEVMRESDRRARAAERACADATEAAVLHDRVGQGFSAVVIDHAERGMEVQLVDEPVVALVEGDRAPLGGSLTVRLERADIRSGTVAFVRS